MPDLTFLNVLRTPSWETLVETITRERYKNESSIVPQSLFMPAYMITLTIFFPFNGPIDRRAHAPLLWSFFVVNGARQRSEAQLLALPLTNGLFSINDRVP
jgi:hypothetical protein